jgi:hypothetical protein
MKKLAQGYRQSRSTTPDKPDCYKPALMVKYSVSLSSSNMPTPPHHINLKPWNHLAGQETDQQPTWTAGATDSFLPERLAGDGTWSTGRWAREGTVLGGRSSGGRGRGSESIATPSPSKTTPEGRRQQPKPRPQGGARERAGWRPQQQGNRKTSMTLSVQWPAMWRKSNDCIYYIRRPFNPNS